ncbi:hypothetical protein BH20ACT2_BH20ACT2_18500 [soil metagenome]
MNDSPPDDMAERGRAIFERLRNDAVGATKTESSPASEHPPPGEVAPADRPAAGGEGGAEDREPGAGSGGPAPEPDEAMVPDGDPGAEPSVERPDEAQPVAPDGDLAAGPSAEGLAPSAAEGDGHDAGHAAPPAGRAEPAERPAPAHEAASIVDAAGAPPTAPDLPDPTSIAADLADAAPAVASANGVQVPVRRDLPRVLAVTNQKGGVGKTTTAVNLGACLADLGYRVLVVDLDPQGNASTGLGINPRGLQSSMYDVILHDVAIDDCVEASSVRNLFVAPASLDLAGAEIELVPAFSRELKLRNALQEVRDDYDYVLIDCPPSLGLLTVNALAAATEVLVPIQCEYYALEGLGQLLRNVNLVQKNLNDDLVVSTIVLVMYDARTKLSDQVARQVREHFGDKVCRSVIPRTVRLSEAPSFGQPIIAFDSSSRGAIAYRELAKEVSGGTPQRAG